MRLGEARADAALGPKEGEAWVLVTACDTLNTCTYAFVIGARVPPDSCGPGSVRSLHPEPLWGPTGHWTCAASPLLEGRPLNSQTFPAPMPRFPPDWQPVDNSPGCPVTHPWV